MRLFRHDIKAVSQTTFREASWLGHFHESVVKRGQGCPMDLTYLRQCRGRSHEA